MSTSRVLHIGAADGEIEFYASHGVDKLVYVEPDRECIKHLIKNIRTTIDSGALIDVKVIPKACSSSSGKQLNFYANGSGQSSIERPEIRTLQVVGDFFEHYSVETLSLVDCKNHAFQSDIVDYLCVDTQGHEKPIICGCDIEFLRSNFRIIDVELMTDISQYAVPPDNWRDVVLHLLRAGFEPLIHPHAITESYLFINSAMKPNYFSSIIQVIRDREMKDYFASFPVRNVSASSLDCSSLGDHFFLPLTHVGGSIHASKLQPFREKFVAYYLDNLPFFDF